MNYSGNNTEKCGNCPRPAAVLNEALIMSMHIAIKDEILHQF